MDKKDFFAHWMTVRFSAYAFETCDFTVSLEGLSDDDLTKRTYVAPNFLACLPWWMNNCIHPARRVEIKRAIPYLLHLQELQIEAIERLYCRVAAEMDAQTSDFKKLKKISNGQTV